MSAPDFIELYDHALDAESCRALIDRFDRSGRQQRGETGGGLDLALKDSWDLRIDDHADWHDARRQLHAMVLAGLRRYLRRYPQVALSPLQLKMLDPATGAQTPLDAERLAALPDAQLDALAGKVFRPGTINIQRYRAGEGGYPYWHSEIYPRRDQAEALHRVLLWTLYLNDGFSAGETEFMVQQRRIVPKTGSLLIAPAGFTHTHRGNRPQGSDKYIATSWILFQRAERL